MSGRPGSVLVLVFVALSIAAPATAQSSRTSPDGQQADPRPAPDADPPGRAFRVTAFAYGGRLTLTASKSFDAILGTASGTVVGGGAQVTVLAGPLRHVFFQVDASRFEESGHRVFVHEGEVFPLRIRETISLRPLDFTVGYRYPIARRGRDGRTRTSPFVPYGGGGIGIVRYQDVSDFAEAGDDVDEGFTSYHVLGGLDVPIWRGLGVGVDVHYRWVPDGLGTGGVSKEFNETNLGGMTVRAKVGFSF